VNQVQTDSSGGTRKFDFSPTLGIGVAINFPYDNWYFLPELKWVLPNPANSENVIKNIFMVRGDIGYDVVDWLRLRLGMSLMHLNQQGRGGSVKINNGNTESTFFNPDENRSSLNNTLDAGVEALFSDWSVRLQTYTYALFDNERTQYSYTLFISYYWDQ
jgi:hypothetical protein